jgi:hypothetical protein
MASISLSSYTFETNEWIKAPTLFPERFRNEALEQIRRENDTAYKLLVGNKSTWYKYVAVGYHCYDHCLQFETQWNNMAKSESEIITFVWLMHSYHLDKKLFPLAILTKWAKDIAQPCLAIHKPAVLTMAITDPLEARRKYNEQDPTDVKQPRMKYNEQDPMDLEDDKFDKLLPAQEENWQVVGPKHIHAITPISATELPLPTCPLEAQPLRCIGTRRIRHNQRKKRQLMPR